EPLLVPPTGQGPVDTVYHCSVARPACAPSLDPIATVAATYATGVPPASTTFPGPGQSCDNPPSLFGAGTWYINCDTFQVKNQQVRFQAGTVVFAGGISIGSGGTLVVNAEIDGAGAPVLDATGLPVVAAPGNDALVVARGGVDMQSSGATMVMAQTTLYQTTGGLNLQGGPHVNWTSPVGGGLKNLLYWNESGGQLSVQGTPDFHGDGIFFLPDSLLSIQGNGVLDATGVQFWVGHVETQGASVFRLKPNSQRSVHVGGPGSRLI